MQQVLIEEATADPVSLTEAKAHCRVDLNIEDDLIEGLIRTATDYVEGYTRRILLRQLWRTTYSCFPSVIELPVLPVRKVVSIQYIDSAGAEQTLSAAVYQVNTTSSDRALIMPVYGEIWPATQPGTFNAVTVNFIAGHAVPFTTTFGGDPNALNATAHPFADDDVLQVWNQDGDLPAGLTARTNYYVVNATADAFELSLTSGGAPVTLTGDGTGTHFAGLIPAPLQSALKLMVGHLYENREQTVFAALNEIPFGIESLLMPYTSVRF